MVRICRKTTRPFRCFSYVLPYLAFTGGCTNHTLYILTMKIKLKVLGVLSKSPWLCCAYLYTSGLHYSQLCYLTSDRMTSPLYIVTTFYNASLHWLDLTAYTVTGILVHIYCHIYCTGTYSTYIVTGVCNVCKLCLVLYTVIECIS